MSWTCIAWIVSWIAAARWSSPAAARPGFGREWKHHAVTMIGIVLLFGVGAPTEWLRSHPLWPVRRCAQLGVASARRRCGICVYLVGATPSRPPLVRHRAAQSRPPRGGYRTVCDRAPPDLHRRDPRDGRGDRAARDEVLTIAGATIHDPSDGGSRRGWRSGSCESSSATRLTTRTPRACRCSSHSSAERTLRSMPTLSRRSFVIGATSLLLKRASQRTVVFMCDGFGPDYLDASDMPTLARWRRSGISKVVKGGMPAVTNTNNSSICTGTWPAEHRYYRQIRISTSARERERTWKTRACCSLQPSSNEPRSAA